MFLVRTVSQNDKAIYRENRLVYKGQMGRKKSNVSRNVEPQVLLGEIKALCHACSNSDNISIIMLLVFGSVTIWEIWQKEQQGFLYFLLSLQVSPFLKYCLSWLNTKGELPNFPTLQRCKQALNACKKIRRYRVMF